MCYLLNYRIFILNCLVRKHSKEEENAAARWFDP